ncbi:uncharacterized protein LOC120106267 [Phoenix dactylifera]|uniref:Uncharacterized protein LOC120106267 n=1 Tax=Phoenix dactylifera TaxID=42345 RepID=A0A8B8ZLT7_PHODC|nr:uncharacterized protein LOC120106267 [Phoenix dactylifera]
MRMSGGVIICLLIVIMDVVAGILGIEAEIAQNKVLLLLLHFSIYLIYDCRKILLQGKHLRVFFVECKEPVHEAYKLGLAAAGLLALAHAVANVLGGCMWIRSRSFNKKMAAAP